MMIIDLLRQRYSVRRFQDRPIPGYVLREMLEAGRLAPSGGNEQPWRFGVITDRGLIEQVADVAYGQSWIARAPLLIVLCTAVVGDERGGRDIQRDRFPEYAAAIAELDGKIKDLADGIEREFRKIKAVATRQRNRKVRAKKATKSNA